MLKWSVDETNGGSIDRSICTPRVWSCLIQPGAFFGPNCEAKAAVTCGRAVSATGKKYQGSLDIHSESSRNSLKSDRVIQNPFKIHSKSIENPFKIHWKSIQNPFEIHWHVKSMESTSKIQQNPSWLKCSELFWWDMKKYEKAGGLRQTHFRLWLSLPFDWRKSGRGIESIESSGCR